MIAHLNIFRMDSDSPKHADGVINEFADLVSERILPIDTITKIIVLSQGALWKQRMMRDSDKKQIASGASPAVIESSIFQHVLALHRVLLDSGIVELAEAPPMDAAEHDLAQRITATFRRTLPALRVAGKWLRANLKYVANADVDAAKLGLRIGEVQAFWAVYARFVSALKRSFPPDRLPQLVVPLEEDVEMRGFLPLRKMMVGEGRPATEKKSAETPGMPSAQVHPNEEQLMRISDLLDDVKALIEMEVR